MMLNIDVDKYYQYVLLLQLVAHTSNSSKGDNLNTKNLKSPRQEIEVAIDNDDLPKLLRISGLLHGHYCPGSAMGVKAATRAVKELRIQSTGMEEIVAIVETNSCFADGVQMITGCSLGNNALIYRDYGKTAFTLAKRTGEGIRVSALFERVNQERSPEANELWEKVVVKRSGSEEESQRLNDLWRELSFRVLELPDEEVLDIKKVSIEVPAYARIFTSVRCSICGESVMEPRARMKDGKPICLPCSDHPYYQLAGDGISTITR
jgi:formylmethanofuran dehydrogenase subunit E